MTDDIAKQRFWSENKTKPDLASQAPATARGRRSRRSLRAAVAATHVLMVRKNGCLEWCIAADEGGDISGSEASCAARCLMSARHWPADEFRVWTWPEARRELRRKTWSVRDADHIADGERVMLMVTPAQLHPSIVEVRGAFGAPDDGADRRRTGVVGHRYRRSGGYMVRIDGSSLSVGVSRADLIYPVPDNLVPLERKPVR